MKNSLFLHLVGYGHVLALLRRELRLHKVKCSIAGGIKPACKMISVSMSTSGDGGSFPDLPALGLGDRDVIWSTWDWSWQRRDQLRRAEPSRVWCLCSVDRNRIFWILCIDQMSEGKCEPKRPRGKLVCNGCWSAHYYQSVWTHSCLVMDKCGAQGTASDREVCAGGTKAHSRWLDRRVFYWTELFWHKWGLNVLYIHGQHKPMLGCQR